MKKKTEEATHKMGGGHLFGNNSTHSFDTQNYREALRLWGQQNYRPYPWRQSNNSYHILIAEVMLHRTQAIQVVPLYLRFIKQYPDINSVALASYTDLYDALYSLGLCWRIELIHKMADEIIKRFKGEIPQDKTDLLSLPGVSEYIAGAVRCFVWKKPEPLIDTNSVRVVGRIFGLDIKESSRRNRKYRDIISELVDPVEPATYNYALLDLAERVCMRKRPPKCLVCPVQGFCVYGCRQVLVDKEIFDDRI